MSLKWRTATEKNNYGFEIERKIDKKEWTKIGFVAGCGVSNSPKDYSFKDNTLSRSATYYYRLKQIDNDATVEYSPVTSAMFITGFAVENNYPNPFNPSTVIAFSLPDAGLVTLKIYDVLGNLVTTLLDNEMKESGIHEIKWNAAAMQSGVYVYTLSSADKCVSRKMTLLK